MTEIHTRYHPRWYRVRKPIFWWLGKPSHRKFIARELTSLAVAYAALLLLAQLVALARGEESARRFAALLATPWALALHGFVCAGLLFHAVTWLHLAPKAMVVALGGRKVPDGALLAGHYLAWLAASAAVGWIVLGG
jgi:fumarate reductase subunit C